MNPSITPQGATPVVGNDTIRTILRVVWWGLILGAALYYVYRDVLPYFSWDQGTFGRYGSHAGWILLHITGGLLALLLGPVQFWTGMRRRYLRAHRWSGRVYLGSVGVSAVASSYMLMLPGSFGFRIGMAGLALAWVATTGLAYVAARKGQIVQHKEWMVRSYVVTFGFVFFRVFLDPLLALEIATPQEIVSAVSWMCWALPLLITELVLQGRKIIRKQEVPVPVWSNE